jgi:hypothetical protein
LLLRKMPPEPLEAPATASFESSPGSTLTAEIGPLLPIFGAYLLTVNEAVAAGAEGIRTGRA